MLASSPQTMVRRRILNSISLWRIFIMRVLHILSLLLLATTAPSLAQVAKTGRANVRNYGALCNGTNDDTSAFQRAIAAALVGGVVFVPPGHCVVSQTLVIGSSHPVSIAGDGVGSQIFQNSSA